MGVSEASPLAVMVWPMCGVPSRACMEGVSCLLDRGSSGRARLTCLKVRAREGGEVIAMLCIGFYGEIALISDCMHPCLCLAFFERGFLNGMVLREGFQV